MPGRHRYMYYLTGLPGWMRFGYRPGWEGAPPGADFSMSGQGPVPPGQAPWWTTEQRPFPWYGAGMGGAYPGFQPAAGPAIPREQELGMLKNQVQFLNQQIEYINTRIKELEDERT